MVWDTNSDMTFFQGQNRACFFSFFFSFLCILSTKSGWGAYFFSVSCTPSRVFKYFKKCFTTLQECFAPWLLRSDMLLAVSDVIHPLAKLVISFWNWKSSVYQKFLTTPIYIYFFKEKIVTIRRKISIITSEKMKIIRTLRGTNFFVFELDERRSKQKFHTLIQEN